MFGEPLFDAGFSDQEGQETIKEPAYRGEDHADSDQGEQTADDGIGVQSEDLLENAQDDDMQPEDRQAVAPDEHKECRDEAECAAAVVFRRRTERERVFLRQFFQQKDGAERTCERAESEQQRIVEGQLVDAGFPVEPCERAACRSREEQKERGRIFRADEVSGKISGGEEPDRAEAAQKSSRKKSLNSRKKGYDVQYKTVQRNNFFILNGSDEKDKKQFGKKQRREKPHGHVQRREKKPVVDVRVL